MSEVEPSVGALAQALRRSVSGFVRAVRHDAGTPKSAQSDALDLLNLYGPMNIAALAERRGVTHQAMRLVVAPLISAGSVQQVVDPADRRSRLLSISMAGRDRLAGEQDARASWIERAIATTLSPDEQATLRAALPLIDRLTRVSLR